MVIYQLPAAGLQIILLVATLKIERLLQLLEIIYLSIGKQMTV